MLKKVKYPVTVEEIADTICNCAYAWDSPVYTFQNEIFGDYCTRIIYNLSIVIDDEKNIYIGCYGNNDIEINSVEYEENFSNELNLDSVPSYEKGPSSDDYKCEDNWWNSHKYEQWVGTWHDELFDAEDLKNVYFKGMCEWFASDINKAIKNHFEEAE